MNLFLRTVLILGLTLLPTVAFAECTPHSITMSDHIVSFGSTLGVSLVSAMVLTFTLASSLAGAGYRQSAANAAAFGLAGFLGGATGTGFMAMHDCGVTNVNGGVSLAVAALGTVVLLVSVVTGKA